MNTQYPLSDYYCPVCGERMIVYAEQIDYRAGHQGETITMIHCINTSDSGCCALYMSTTTPDQVVSGDLADRWHVPTNYDVVTGVPL